MAEHVAEVLEWRFVGNDAPLGAAFQKAEALSKQHTNNINKQLSGIGTTINTHNYFLADMKKVEREAEQHVGRMNSMFGKLKSGVGGIMSGAASVFGGNILMSAFTGAADLVKEFVSMGFSFAESWDQAGIRIAAFTGRAKEAQDILKGVYDIAVDRGLKFEPFADYAVKLASANYNANETIHTLRGAAAAAEALGKGSEDLQAFVGMIAQMEDSGKAAGRALIQLEKQGFQVFATLEKMTGVDRKVIAKKFQLGEVDARGAIEALTEGWSRQYKDYRDTLQEETERTQLMLAKESATAFSPLLEAQKHTMQDLQAVIKAAGPGFAQGMNAAMGYAASAMTSSLDYIIKLAGIKLETQSPSKVFERYGIMVMQGLGKGFLEGGGADKELVKALDKIVNNPDLQKMVQAASAKWNVPAELINAVMAQESRGNPRATSPKGAKGLMQMMPGTASDYGVTHPYNAEQSIEGGAHLLADLLKEFNGNIKLVLAAYNAGSGAVKKYGNQVPPYRETQDYVQKVTGVLGGAGSGSQQQPATQWGGIYAGVPTGTTSMLSMNDEEEARLKEFNRIIDEGTAQLKTLMDAIKKAGAPGASAQQQYNATFYQSRADKLQEMVTQTVKDKDAFLQQLSDAQNNRAVWRDYFNAILKADQPLSGMEMVQNMIKRGQEGPIEMTGPSAKELSSVQPNMRKMEAQTLTSFMGRVQESAEALDKLKDNTIATADEQKKWADKMFGNTTIFGDARKQLMERQSGLDQGIRDSKVQGIVDIPKNLAGVFTDFVTKWNFTWRGAQQLLVGGLRTVLVEPLSRVFSQMVEKWIANMLINLLGEKIMGAGKIASETANTTASVANTAASVANTAAVVALTAVIGASAATGFVDTLLKGAEAGASNAAGGGFIQGPGTGTSDEVPIWASNGEYVIKQSVVQQHGKDFFDRLNSDQPTHMMASGGPISSSAGAYSPPVAFQNAGGRGGNITKEYHVHLTAPVLGGSSHATPRSRREYLEMLSGPLKEVMAHAG